MILWERKTKVKKVGKWLLNTPRRRLKFTFSPSQGITCSFMEFAVLLLLVVLMLAILLRFDVDSSFGVVKWKKPFKPPRILAVVEDGFDKEPRP